MAKRKVAPKTKTKSKAKVKADKWDLAEEKEIKRELNIRQKEWVREYLLCRNASEASRRVYDSKNPDVDGPRMLGNAGIKAMIAEEETAMQKKYEATRDEVINLLAGIALLDPMDILDQDPDGETRFKKLRHMPKQARLALEIYGSTNKKNPFVSFKSMTKDKAIEHLKEYLGINNGSGTGKDTKRAAIERVRDYLNRRLEKE